MNRIAIKILCHVLLFMLVISDSVYAQEKNDTSIVVEIIIPYNDGGEDNRLCFTELKSDVPAYIVDGTTMVPLRVLAEEFGYDVDYQERDKKIIIQDADRENELIFTVGSATVLQNGKPDTMLQAPVINNNRTFIPLRYVSEFFGKYVTWKKSIDGKTMFIWVSAVQLLTEDDVAAEKDDNYYVYNSDDPMFYYYLKSGGQTYRGIRIGDSCEKVVELYGEPHEKQLKDGVLYRIGYRTEGFVNGGDGQSSVLTFYLKDGIVYDVGVDGRW